MRAMRVAAVVSGLWAVLASAPASGAGFGLNEHGAAAMAMAGAYTAIAATPEATFFNPAGLATLKGLQFAAGFTMITPGTSYKGIAPGTELETRVDAERLYHFVPNAHIGWRVHERVAVGFEIGRASCRERVLCVV